MAKLQERQQANLPDHAAIVLAGGLSSRLGGFPKEQLQIAGMSLLETALRATLSARPLVVVGSGPVPDVGRLIMQTVERPAHGGPVRGLAAGLRLVAAHAPADLPVVVLACDMPFAEAGLSILHAALANTAAADGVIAVDTSGERQPLLSIIRLPALQRVLPPDLPTAGRTPSLRSLFDSLDVEPVGVRGTSTDIDTWDAARRFHARVPEGAPT